MDLNNSTSKVNRPLVHFIPYSLTHFKLYTFWPFCFRNVAFAMYLDIYTMSRYTVHAMHVEKPKGMEEVYINNNICNPQCPLQFCSIKTCFMVDLQKLA
jgi:hypothetical protein